MENNLESSRSILKCPIVYSDMNAYKAIDACVHCLIFILGTVALHTYRNTSSKIYAHYRLHNSFRHNLPIIPSPMSRP